LKIVSDKSESALVLMPISIQKPDTHFDQITSLLFTSESKDLIDPFWVSEMFLLEKEHPYQWALKSLLDKIMSAFILLLLSPFIVLIAIFIKLDSKGPVFFNQMRVGKNGQEFKMYKFRSMYSDAEKQLQDFLSKNETNEGMFKLFDDPRITSVGNILRKYSLDELPQLFNVLKGEMSLVGPRPPIKRELEGYETWHYIRFASTPGLTGMWQTHGRSLIKSFDEVVAFDSYYIKNWSLLLDIVLLFKTIPVVFLAKGAA